MSDWWKIAGFLALVALSFLVFGPWLMNYGPPR
jgi:hypothetical protein